MICGRKTFFIKSNNAVQTCNWRRWQESQTHWLSLLKLGQEYSDISTSIRWASTNRVSSVPVDGFLYVFRTFGETRKSRHCKINKIGYWKLNFSKKLENFVSWKGIHAACDHNSCRDCTMIHFGAHSYTLVVLGSMQKRGTFSRGRRFLQIKIK